MSARDIIASAIEDLYPNTELLPLTAAIRAVRHLDERGYTIVRKDEVREAALERQPTEEMMDAVRHIVQWLQEPTRPTEERLFSRAKVLRKPIPEGCREGIDHVPPARLIAYWIWQGMFDARSLKQKEPSNA